MSEHIEKRRLQKWMNDNQPKESLIYKSGMMIQALFVRDTIASIFARSFEEYDDLVDIHGTHTSKSVTLPVYYIALKDIGFEMWMRYNFHDWNISIKSKQPITADFLKIFNDEDGYEYCFCQGMEDKKFGRFGIDNKQFTVCVPDNYHAFTFCWIVRQNLGITYK